MTARHLIALAVATFVSLASFSYGCGTDTGTDFGLGDAADENTGSDGSETDGAFAGDGTLGDGAGDGSRDGSGADGTSVDGSGSDGGSGIDGAVVGNDGGWFGNEAGSCTPLGQQCTSGTECCSGQCNGGSCQPPSCISDNAACTLDAQCCGGTCTGNACAALNAACKTLGNACTVNADCCSSLCSGGTCAQSSFCGQVGDVCVSFADCCGGACTKATNAVFGTCGQPPSTGAQCSMVDGTVCAGTEGLLVDGGVVLTDGGLPKCGGACCSRLCAPWGPTGVLICQPASGCRPVGDVCLTDSDCCGGPGVPGPLPPSGKTTKCNITPPNSVGVCGNPQGCKPNGDICRLQTNECNATDECCSGNVQQNDTCKQDILGIPRCSNVACVTAGTGCATSADCCGGVPCVPNPGYTRPDGGVPEFVCGATACVATTGLCTNNADCCPGNICNIPLGSTRGTCSPLTGPPFDGGTSGDSGTSDSGTGDSGTPNDSGAVDSGTPCSLFGQTCTVNANCCNGVPCTNGRCITP